MSEASDKLIDYTHDLVESIKGLREALLEYQQGCERLLEAGDPDRHGGSTVERIELLKFADKRARLNAALTEFETFRRRARLGLIAVADEEGSNLSEVARTLRVSRQLLSRQWNEGQQEAPER